MTDKEFFFHNIKLQVTRAKILKAILLLTFQKLNRLQEEKDITHHINFVSCNSLMDRSGSISGSVEALTVR